MTIKQAKQQFIRLQDLHPFLGDTILLAKLIKGKKYKSDFISKLYRNLVTEQYPAKTKKELLLWYKTL